VAINRSEHPYLERSREVVIDDGEERFALLGLAAGFHKRLCDELSQPAFGGRPCPHWLLLLGAWSFAAWISTFLV
jgi:hypothetical protein